MDWAFNGVGTLLVGLLVGAGGGTLVTRSVMVRSFRQKQVGGDNSRQIQSGRDTTTRRRDG